MTDKIEINLQPVWNNPGSDHRPILHRWHGWVTGGWRSNKHYYGPWRGYVMWRIQLEADRRKRELVKFLEDEKGAIRKEIATNDD